MAEEGPPALTSDWIENEESRDAQYLGNVLYFESRGYLNSVSKFYFEGIVTFKILNQGIILVAWAVRQKFDGLRIIYYLQLNDGSWVKSKPDVNYTCELDIDSLNDAESIVTVIISIETDGGIKKRIIVEKHKDIRL